MVSWVNPRPFQDNYTHTGHGIAMDYLTKTLNSNVYAAAVETPLQYASALSAFTKNKVRARTRRHSITPCTYAVPVNAMCS